MSRVYSKLFHYLSIFLALFFKIEAQAVDWNEENCRGACTEAFCQESSSGRAMCKRNCPSAYLAESCLVPDAPAATPPITRYNKPYQVGTPMGQEISERAQDLEGKILNEPRISEIPQINEEKGIALEGDVPILTTKGILMVLKKMGKIKSTFNPNNILNNSLVADGDTVKVLEKREGSKDKKIARISRSYTGSYSSQIFFVTLGKDLLPSPDAPRYFVIKGVDWAPMFKDSGDKKGENIKFRDEPTPAKEVQDVTRVQQIIVPKLIAAASPYLPLVYTSEDVGYYFDETGNKNFVTVLETAEGQSLHEITETFVNSIYTDTGAFEKWKEAMSHVGRALGTFHWLFASPQSRDKFSQHFDLNDLETVVHGDLHFSNIFYGDSVVSFIDIASMADSLYKPKSVIKDLKIFYSFAKFRYPYVENLDLHGMGMFNEGFKAFAEGYAEAIAPDRKAELAKVIYAQFKAWSISIQYSNIHSKISYWEWVERVRPGYEYNETNDSPLNMLAGKLEMEKRNHSPNIPRIITNLVDDPIIKTPE